jgi:hypothetical protein
MDMILRGLHVGFGELVLLFTIATLFILAWVSPNRKVIMAKIASLIGVVSAFVSWLVSGLYYVIYYGPQVKPVIKEGPWPWAHGIFMEGKEHIFLFLPFIAMILLFLVWKYADRWNSDRAIRFSIYAIGIMAIFIPVLMAVSGYLISSGYRIATLG